jgi:hypothetical protein
MLTPRYKQIAGLLPDGKVLVAGGSDEHDYRGLTATAEIFDPSTGRFTATSSLNDARFKLPDEAARLAGDKLLIAGGSTKLEIFDSTTGHFTVLPDSLNAPLHFMTETRLADGTVLLLGGYPNSDRAESTAWIYRP